MVYRDGETIFVVGERDFKFHVIISGEGEILGYSGEMPKTVTIHRKDGFTAAVNTAFTIMNATTKIAAFAGGCFWCIRASHRQAGRRDLDRLRLTSSISASAIPVAE